MKRRVIQLAGKTHVVSLPSKWVREFNIKKGDSLDVEDIGNTLSIRPESPTTKIKRISLNVENFEDLSFRYAMSGLHKAGYDELTLYFTNDKFNQTIETLLRTLFLGFVVAEQTSKKLVLKKVANEINTELEPTLRRAFLVTISFAKSTFEAVKSGNFSTLRQLMQLKDTNNQLVSFCIRLINKGFPEYEERKSFLVIIIWGLGRITEEYKAICIGLMRSSSSKEVSSEIIDLYSRVNNFLESYYNALYNFSVENLNSMVKMRNDLIKLTDNIKPDTLEETILVSRLSAIVSKTADLSSSIFALHHKELAYDIS